MVYKKGKRNRARVKKERRGMNEEGMEQEKWKI